MLTLRQVFYFKICLHHGPEIDPDKRDDTDDSWVVERVSKYVKAHFPGLIPVPSIKETCIYTVTVLFVSRILIGQTILVIFV